MIIVLVAVAALSLMLGVLLYLVEFARVSRNDVFFVPADSRSTRRARRVTGMYVRGVEELSTRGGDEELVGR
ncbi:hypothetical protein AB0J52_27600 [Spirillospora sp. NPDC049652]